MCGPGANRRADPIVQQPRWRQGCSCSQGILQCFGARDKLLSTRACDSQGPEQASAQCCALSLDLGRRAGLKCHEPTCLGAMPATFTNAADEFSHDVAGRAGMIAAPEAQNKPVSVNGADQRPPNFLKAK